MRRTSVRLRQSAPDGMGRRNEAGTPCPASSRRRGCSANHGTALARCRRLRLCFPTNDLNVNEPFIAGLEFPAPYAARNASPAEIDPAQAADPRRHGDNRTQKGLARPGTAIRSLEGARASPKPAAGRYAPPRTCQGSLRDPYGQTLDRTSPAQILAAIGFGGGVVGRQDHGRLRSHR